MPDMIIELTPEEYNEHLSAQDIFGDPEEFELALSELSEGKGEA